MKALFVLLFGCLTFAASAEIRAVWDHTGRGLYEGDWLRTMRVLKEAQVTDLFVNVGGVDFANYASAFLPRSRVCKVRGDQLSACLAAAKGSGVRVHAWFICFNATRQNEKLLEAFRQSGWRLKDAKGALTTYLDPSNARVRARVLAALAELTRYSVDGIHLDFVRWGDAAVKPRDAAQQISSFVAEARRRVKRPTVLSAAVYGKYPACIASVGQDWPRWIDFNIVDYVVPMDYTASLPKFRELLASQASPSTHAKRTIIGLGVTANESTLSAAQVVEQIGLVRKSGFAGQALFDLDDYLVRTIFPALASGGW